MHRVHVLTYIFKGPDGRPARWEPDGEERRTCGGSRMSVLAELPADTAVIGRDETPRQAVMLDERRSVAQVRLVDGFVAVLAATSSYLVRFVSAEQLFPAYLWLSLTFPFVWVVLVARSGAYEPRFLHLGTEEYRRVLNAGLVLALLSGVGSYALKAELARGYLLPLVTLATAGTLLGRYANRRRLYRRRAAGTGWMRRVLVCGHAEEVMGVVNELGRNRWHGYEVAGVCVAEHSLGRARGCDVPVFGGLDRIADAALACQVDAVVVLPCRHLAPRAMRRLGWRLERSAIQLLVAPGLVDVAYHRTTVSPVGNLPMLHVDHAVLRGRRRVAKAVFDRAVAGLALVLAAPLLLALVVAIRLDSPGPAIFRQERIGRDGRRFVLYRLRTMMTETEWKPDALLDLNESEGVRFTIGRDPRLTHVGRLLRRYSLDGLPQLLNVLCGEMSLVGPRPTRPSEVHTYREDLRRRLMVRPGLTGLWRVGGRSDLPGEEAIRLDLRYVDNWSLLLDVLILWKTGYAVLSQPGAS
jgi:exopolysaccharide biosynthesis polyprenyl glycosylphosphotransferase